LILGPDGVFGYGQGYDSSGLIDDSIRTLQRDLLEEAIIVSLVIIVFLFHFRSALIPILTLPIAVLASFIPMYYLHVTSNIMSLGGLALAIGVLVDAAIVMVENGYRHLSERGAHNKHHQPAGTNPNSSPELDPPGDSVVAIAQELPLLTERERRKLLLDAAKQVGPAIQ
jgi:Cu(I)/Ag(I) efflux system membrane protein CusA/SilA